MPQLFSRTYWLFGQLMQSELFVHGEGITTNLKHDLGDASIQEFPCAFSARESDQYLCELIATIPWQQDTLWIAGKEIQVPRLQCWMGDRGSNYSYSGIRLEPKSWSRPVLQIKKRVEQLCQRQFNSVLLNYYRNGLDSVSWHADDEKELGKHPVIASVSFGANRKFQFRPKLKTDKRRFQMDLRHGSLLLMSDTLQNNWLHQLPKLDGLIEPRINLTFRIIY